MVRHLLSLACLAPNRVGTYDSAPKLRNHGKLQKAESVSVVPLRYPSAWKQVAKEAHHRPVDQFLLVYLQTWRDPGAGRGGGDRRLSIHARGRRDPPIRAAESV